MFLCLLKFLSDNDTDIKQPKELITNLIHL